MQELSKDFNIPYYIFEEIVDYIRLTVEGNSKCMKWENIKYLLKMAVINNSLTKEQANFLENKFCREQNSTK